MQVQRVLMYLIPLGLCIGLTIGQAFPQIPKLDKLKKKAAELGGRIRIGKPRQAPSEPVSQPNSQTPPVRKPDPTATPTSPAGAGGGGTPVPYDTENRQFQTKLYGRPQFRGAMIYALMPEIDSRKLKLGEKILGFIPRITTDTTGGYRAEIEVTKLGMDVKGGGYAELELSLRSFESDDSASVSPGWTKLHLFTNADDFAEAEAKAAGRVTDTAASKEIEDIFGSGKFAAFIPAGRPIYFALQETRREKADVVPGSAKPLGPSDRDRTRKK
jgi:hypothetical protein